MNPIYLGVNLDHIATLRQARGTIYPDPIQALYAAEQGGADGITLHLREDRRHIQDRDVQLIRELLTTRLNLEMAVTSTMIQFAKTIKPHYCCLVPEKREEITTEGGLNILAQEKWIADSVSELMQAGIEVSLFIDPDPEQIQAAKRSGASTIEIHTGCYAGAQTLQSQKKELARISQAAIMAHELGLVVNAGHGLHYHNVADIAAISVINEINIGHAIIANALFVGLEVAVRNMKNILLASRKSV